MKSYDVVIIGYGPVGATMANLLGREGLSVAIIDRYAQVYDKPRAITVDHEAMRCFQACGLADEIAPTIGIHRGTDYVGVDNQIIKIFNPTPEPYPLGWPPAITFLQPELEAILRKGLKRFAHVDEFLGCDARIARQNAATIDVSLSPVAGEAPQDAIADGDRTLTGKYVIACDGANSSVRSSLGITLEDLGFNEWWIVLDALAKDVSKMPARSHQYCRPSRPGTHIIGPGKLRRWEIKLLPGETPADFKNEDAVKRELARFIDPALIDIWRIAIYQFHAVVADDWRNGNIFLMGDAAHRMPPFLGQGMCAGLRDAYNFAWKIVQVERYGARDSLLDTYRVERRPHVKTVVANAKEFGLIIGELDEAKARARDARLEAELKSGTAETIRSRFIPDLADGLLARAGGDPKAPLSQLAGSLFVQPKVIASDGSQMFLDDVTGPRFLLACQAGLAAGIPADALEKWHALGGVIATITQEGPLSGSTPAGAGAGRPLNLDLKEMDGLFTGWCLANSCKAAIVRPDRYVYAVASDAEAIAQHIQTLHQTIGTK